MGQEIRGIEENFWRDQLAKFVLFSNLQAQRCPIPFKEQSTSHICLLCFSDAGAKPGGTAIYTGRKLQDGSWSSSLIVSKSKLMKSTIPRNELSAILIIAELAYLVKKSIEDRVQEIMCFTSSTIALS